MSARAAALAEIERREMLARDALHPDAVRPGEWTTEHHNSEYHSEAGRCHIAEDRSGVYWTVAHEVYIPNAEHMAAADPSWTLHVLASHRAVLRDWWLHPWLAARVARIYGVES